MSSYAVPTLSQHFNFEKYTHLNTKGQNNLYNLIK